MTRKDYQLIADSLRTTVQERWPADSDKALAIHVAALDLCEVLARDNPRFNSARFMNAVEGRV